MHVSLRSAIPAAGVLLLSALVATPAGAADVLPSSGVTAAPAPVKWPGDAAVATADGAKVFGKNLSGLSFQGADVLWAVKNGPGTLYRLVRNGTAWRLDTANGWSSGKALRYKNGSGDPDGEGVVATPDGVVVATERDGDNSSKSSLKVLRYDVSSSSRTLKATAEWDLTRDLPSVSDNSGLEAVSWVPDSFLTANGFRDERTNSPYNPASYANHGSGLYFVGLEDNGTIYAYALDQAGGKYTKVATITSGFPQIMDLEFEPGTGRLWAICDDNCEGRSSTLQLSGGRFTVSAVYDRPSQMPDYNNEGFAIAPAGACSAGKKQVVWADDNSDDGHALRAGTLPCTSK